MKKLVLVILLPALMACQENKTEATIENFESALRYSFEKRHELSACVNLNSHHWMQELNNEAKSYDLVPINTSGYEKSTYISDVLYKNGLLTEPKEYTQNIGGDPRNKRTWLLYNFTDKISKNNVLKSIKSDSSYDYLICTGKVKLDSIIQVSAPKEDIIDRTTYVDIVARFKVIDTEAWIENFLNTSSLEREGKFKLVLMSDAWYDEALLR